MNCVQSSGLDSPSLTVDAQRLLTLLIAFDAGSSVVFVWVTGDFRTRVQVEAARQSSACPGAHAAGLRPRQADGADVSDPGSG
jgi:hypothetical protein